MIDNFKNLVDGWITGESYPEYTAMGTTELSGTSTARTSCAKVDSTNAVVKCVCVSDWEYQADKATPGTQGKTVKVCLLNRIFLYLGSIFGPPSVSGTAPIIDVVSQYVNE